MLKMLRFRILRGFFEGLEKYFKHYKGKCNGVNSFNSSLYKPKLKGNKKLFIIKDWKFIKD